MAFNGTPQDGIAISTTIRLHISGPLRPGLSRKNTKGLPYWTLCLEKRQEITLTPQNRARHDRKQGAISCFKGGDAGYHYYFVVILSGDYYAIKLSREPLVNMHSLGS